MKLDSGKLVNNYNEAHQWLLNQGFTSDFVMLYNDDTKRQLNVWMYPNAIREHEKNLYLPFKYPNRKIIPSYL